MIKLLKFQPGCGPMVIDLVVSGPAPIDVTALTVKS